MDLKKQIQKSIKNNKRITALLTIFIAIQIAILYNTAGKNLGWDPSVYVAMGKYIYTLGEIGMWEPLRPILIPIILGFFWTLGLPMLTTAPIINATISTAAIIAIYHMTKNLYNKETGFYTAATIITTYTYIFHTTQIETTILASLLIFTTIFLAIKQKFLASGITTSLAFLTRYPSAIIGPAIVTYLAIENTIRKEKTQNTLKNITSYAAGVLTLLIPFLAFNHFYYGNWLQPITSGLQTPLLNPETHLYGVYYITNLIQNNPLLILGPIGIATAIYRKETKYTAFITAILFLYTMHEYFPHKETRYAIIFLPILALFTAKTIQEIQKRQKYIEEIQFKNLLTIILAISLLTSGYTAYNEHSWVNEERENYYQQFTELEANTIGGNEPQIAVYGDFKYINLPVGYINQVYEQHQNQFDYIGIDTCAWYEIHGEETQQEQQEFKEYLNENHEKVYTQETENCQRYIYKIHN